MILILLESVYRARVGDEYLIYFEAAIGYCPIYFVDLVHRALTVLGDVCLAVAFHQ
jgi:hypothetical protein